MARKTYLTNSLDNAKNKAKYDAQVKKILSDKRILAWILKHSVEEFRETSIEQAMACIEGEPEIATVPVAPGSRKPEAISGAATEDSIPNEGKITYDIRFHVVTPTKERIKMFVNVEAQKKYHPGYDLVTRAIFYCARMLSAQLDTEFTADNYDDIKKVYSIWICMDVPQYAQNTITEYSIEQKRLFGNFRGKARYDLLATVLSEEMSVTEKTTILQEEYDIPAQEVEEVLNTMCNLSDRIEEKGIEKGIEEGRLLQLSELVEDGTLTPEAAASKAGLSVEEFQKKFLNRVENR